jgi:5'-deoxynucleotidase
MQLEFEFMRTELDEPSPCQRSFQVATYNDSMLARVPRWTILRTIQKQSVAEHSFLVALWAGRIAQLIGWRPGQPMDHLTLNRWALVHDITESWTGDVPTPMKKFYDHNRLEKSIKFPDGEWQWLRQAVDSEMVGIVKVADLLEAYLFLCVERSLGNTDPLLVEVCAEIHGKLVKASEALPWSTPPSFSAEKPSILHHLYDHNFGGVLG